MLKWLILLAIVICGCSQKSTTDQNRSEQPSGLAQLDLTPSSESHSRTLKSGDYIATLSVRTYDKELDSEGYWGLSGRTTDSLIKSLTITFKGQKMWVWQSAIADLANVNEIHLEATGADATIYITGGDASDSYKCTIYFKNGELVHRRVEHGEFPENFFEETTYTNKSPDG